MVFPDATTPANTPVREGKDMGPLQPEGSAQIFLYEVLVPRQWVGKSHNQKDKTQGQQLCSTVPQHHAWIRTE